MNLSFLFIITSFHFQTPHFFPIPLSFIVQHQNFLSIMFLRDVCFSLFCVSD